MSDTLAPTISAASFLGASESRRGVIPTPSGALPSPSRRRRGMVNLKAWDDHVAAANEANGTASISGAAQVFQMLDPDRIAQAEDDLTAAGTATIINVLDRNEIADAVARSPGAVVNAMSRNLPTTRMSNGAILEDSQPRRQQPEIHLPEPNPKALAAAKATLAAELEAAANSEGKVPPPPAPKQATKTAKKTTTKTEQ